MKSGRLSGDHLPHCKNYYHGQSHRPAAQLGSCSIHARRHALGVIFLLNCERTMSWLVSTSFHRTDIVGKERYLYAKSQLGIQTDLSAPWAYCTLWQCLNDHCLKSLIACDVHTHTHTHTRTHTHTHTYTHTYTHTHTHTPHTHFLHSGKPSWLWLLFWVSFSPSFSVAQVSPVSCSRQTLTSPSPLPRQEFI